MDRDIEVARRRTAQARFALARQPDPLAVFHTRWNPHVDRTTAGGDAGALALVAGVLDDRPAAAALGARLGNPESALIAVDYARAVTRRADLRAGARARSAAMAVGARRRTGQPQRHRHALGGFQEIQFGFGFQVVAPARPARPRLSAPTEQSAEQITDVVAAATAGRVEQVVEVELSAVAAEAAGEVTTTAAVEAPAESASGEESTGFVVLLAFCRIGQHFLGLGDRLVAFLGRRVVRVAVRVVLGEQLARHPLDLVLAGVRGDAQLLVEVFLDPFSLGHIASPPPPCRTRSRRYFSDGSDSACCSPSFASLSPVSADPELSDPSTTVSTTPTSACRSTCSPSL